MAMSANREETPAIINLSDKPQLPQFISLDTGSGGGLRIIQRVCTDYEQLGTLLLDDKDGSKTKKAELSHPCNPEKITHAIISDWLQKGGREPITWATFIAVLKEIGLNPVAHDIETLAGLHQERPLHSSMDSFTSAPREIQSIPETPVQAEVKPPGSNISESIKLDEFKSKPSESPSPHRVDTVKASVLSFRRRFNALKRSTMVYIEKCKMTIMMVIQALTSINASNKNKIFLEEKHRIICECRHHEELFSYLNLYWDYLSYQLLEQLLESLNLEEAAFDDVVRDMARYKEDLHQFMRATTLQVFCMAKPVLVDEDPPPEFRKLVVKFAWPHETKTLEDVASFQRSLAKEYDIQTCAMLLNSITTGSVIVTWFMSVSAAELIKKKVASDVLREFQVVQLEIHTTVTTMVYIDRSLRSDSQDSGSSRHSLLGKRGNIGEVDESTVVKDSDPSDLLKSSRFYQTMGSSNKISQNEVSELAAALDPLTTETAKELFFHLKVQLKTLDDIDDNHSGNMRKIHYVQAWYDGEMDANWEKIVTGLKLVGMHSLAESLTKEKISTSSSSDVTTSSLPPPPATLPIEDELPLKNLSFEPAAHPSIPPLPPSNRVAQVKEGIKHFRDSFYNLLSETQKYMALKESVDPSFLKEVIDRLLALPVAQKAPHVKFFRDSEDDFMKAESVRRLIAILKRYCNYFNYEILLVVIVNFCEAALQHRMQEYCQSLEMFERGTTVDIYLEAISAGPVLSSEFRKMAVTINKPANQCTLYEVRKLKEAAAERASLQPYSVYIDDIISVS